MAVAAGFSIEFAPVRSSPQRFDSVLSIVVWCRVPPHHHIQMPTGSPVGIFLPTPACSLGFPRVLADFGVCGVDQRKDRFRSLRGDSLRDGERRRQGEVRKGIWQSRYKSTGYARTNQASCFVALVGRANHVTMPRWQALFSWGHGFNPQESLHNEPMNQ